MPITSYVQEEHPGRGKGHTSHGNGKGKGHLKHQEEAMADGEYTIVVSGVNHSNHTPANQTGAPSVLADGSTMWTEARDGSIMTTTAPALGGDTEALRLETDNNNGRLRLNNMYDADNRMTLGDLDDLEFDFFVASSSTGIHAPVIRLFVDGDGNLATTADQGELVFEWAYQNFGNVPQGSWIHADLVGGDWAAWQRSNGANRDSYPDIVAFSEWADADGYTPAGGVHFDENSLILGWSIAFGSGNGSGVMYVDNVQIGGVMTEFSI